MASATKPQEPAPAPALGISLTTNLSGNAQVVMQCFVAIDAPEAERATVLDRMHAAGVRLQRLYRIESLQAEIANRAIERENTAEQVSFAELTYREQTEQIRADMQRAVTDDEDKFNRGERRGEYRRTQACAAQLNILAGKLNGAEKERDQTLVNLGRTAARLTVMDERARAEIDALQALLDAAFAERDR